MTVYKIKCGETILFFLANNMKHAAKLLEESQFPDTEKATIQPIEEPGLFAMMNHE